MAREERNVAQLPKVCVYMAMSWSGLIGSIDRPTRSVLLGRAIYIILDASTGQDSNRGSIGRLISSTPRLDRGQNTQSGMGWCKTGLPVRWHGKKKSR